MLLQSVQSSITPARVIVEAPVGESRRVRLTDHVQEVEDEGSTLYTYDEVVFNLPDDRTETAAEIEEQFSAWWIYGSQPDTPTMSIEDRLEELEDLMMEVLENV